ncbi:winged helix-turn-helix transcriptional regulator [Flavobacterium alkalisoli]|uniref:winged helix-turn-helix transcriptional regulator n=1 Tax=Flavobacterium alkalisoli TaxID=2602769 RepID=UPI003A943036
MTAIKETSVIQENKQYALDICPVTYVMEKIGNYWKPIILYHLSKGPIRYSEIKRAIPAITEKVLIQHLKQLESDGLVIRKAKPVVPPYVTYMLSKSGKGLMPVIDAMASWAINERAKEGKQEVTKQ